MTILTLTKVDVGMMEDVGTSANKLIQLDSNAKMPAVDGSLLTGITSGLSGSSDPTLSTNPSGGVGTKYKNTTDGEMFICTDATAGSNVWKNVGAGSGNIIPYHGYGDSYGFSASGTTGPPAWPNVDTIDKFSLVSSSNATDVGNVTVARRNCAGSSSTTHGYAAGGDSTTGTIDKWSMVTDANATDVGDLIPGPSEINKGASSTTHGYGAGGAPSTNLIQKWSFTTDGNATDVGDLTAAGRTDTSGGNTSATHGYCCGGGQSGNFITIDKWAFATDGNATDVGDLTIGTWACGSNSSSTYGYTTGGGRGDEIDKFSFSSDGNATDVGDLLNDTQGKFGVGSSTHGYSAGGMYTNITVIEKFSFSTDGNSVDTTQDLTIGRSLGASSQI